MPEIDSIIIQNIDILEGAMKHATTTMDKALGRAVCELIRKKRDAVGWAGTVGEELTDDVWVAPSEWHSEGGGKKNYVLYVEFDATGGETLSWVSNFSGVLGAGIQFALRTKVVGRAQLRQIFNAEAELIRALNAQGILCDLQEGELSVPIRVSRKALTKAFLEEDFEEALAPVGQALDHVRKARDLLDRFVLAIRAVSN